MYYEHQCNGLQITAITQEKISVTIGSAVFMVNLYLVSTKNYSSLELKKHNMKIRLVGGTVKIMSAQESCLTVEELMLVIMLPLKIF